MTHVFFTSYAREDNDDLSLENTINRISTQVRKNLGFKRDRTIAFFDTTDIKTGQIWEQVLGTALQSIRVLICMCSPTQLNSPFCAKEFELFRQRVQAAKNHLQAAWDDNITILPVIWERGSPQMILPASIAAFQLKDKRLPAGYGDHGLARLGRHATQKTTYDETIESLAEIIGEAYSKPPLPPWPHPVAFAQLPQWFHHPQDAPYSLVVSVLHRDGTAWKPGNGLRTIGAIVDQVAKTVNAAWQEVPGDATLPASIAQALAKRHAVLVIGDAQSVDTAPYENHLASVDGTQQSNVAIVVGFSDSGANAPTASETAAKMKALLPTSCTNPFHDSFVQDDPASVRDALTRAATNVRTSMIQADPAAKVEDAALTAQAEQDGVPLAARPIVTAADPRP